jgi:hypothetical protein
LCFSPSKLDIYEGIIHYDTPNINPNLLFLEGRHKI